MDKLIIWQRCHVDAFALAFPQLPAACVLAHVHVLPLVALAAGWVTRSLSGYLICSPTFRVSTQAIPSNLDGKVNLEKYFLCMVIVL